MFSPSPINMLSHSLYVSAIDRDERKYAEKCRVTIKILQQPLIKLFLTVTRCDLISQVITHNCINLPQRKRMLSIQTVQRFTSPICYSYKWSRMQAVTNLSGKKNSFKKLSKQTDAHLQNTPKIFPLNTHHFTLSWARLMTIYLDAGILQ